MCAASAAVLRDQPLGAALDPRLDPDEERRRALRVEVPQQHPPTAAGRFGGEVDGGGRLPDAALDAVGRQHLHGVEFAVEQVVEGAAVAALSYSAKRSAKLVALRLRRWSRRSMS